MPVIEERVGGVRYVIVRESSRARRHVRKVKTVREAYDEAERDYQAVRRFIEETNAKRAVLEARAKKSKDAYDVIRARRTAGIPPGEM